MSLYSTILYDMLYFAHAHVIISYCIINVAYDHALHEQCVLEIRLHELSA